VGTDGEPTLIGEFVKLKTLRYWAPASVLSLVSIISTSSVSAIGEVTDDFSDSRKKRRYFSTKCKYS
jgi:hypothetical protein